MSFLIFLGIFAPIVILFVAITVSRVKHLRARKPDYENISRLERELFNPAPPMMVDHDTIGWKGSK